MQRHVINGLNVRFDDAGPRSGPVVVMSNSLAADLTMWDDQVTGLADRFRVVRYDTRGHGGTDATPGDYSLDLLCDDVTGLLDHLDIARAHFVGLSLGGMIGQRLTQRAPDRLKSVTLCATFCEAPHDMWDERARIARSGGFETLIEPTLERWLTPGFRDARPEVAARVRRMIAGTSPAGYAGCACAIRDMRIETAADQIRLPCLVVAGEKDPSATLAGMKALHSRIAGAEFASVPDASHLFTVEKPQQAARILRGFLNGLADAGQQTAGARAGQTISTEENTNDE